MLTEKGQAAVVERGTTKRSNAVKAGAAAPCLRPTYRNLGEVLAEEAGRHRGVVHVAVSPVAGGRGVVPRKGRERHRALAGHGAAHLKA
jgi:hypothetical protein